MITNLAETLPPVDIVPQQPAPNPPDYDDMFVYDRARVQLNRLVKDWDSEIADTEQRRKTRDIDIDVNALRQQGELDEDETLVPIRVVDTNIQREQPAYINYLKNSRRLCTFNCLSDPDQNTQQLEQAFTRGMTYVKWENPHYRVIDGAQTHGWDFVEVVEDASKPLGIALEHVGHDKLFFPKTAIDLQFSIRIVRQFDLTILQLDKFVSKYGFDSVQATKIKDSRKQTVKENDTFKVYRCYYKYAMPGESPSVYVGWFSLENGVTDWLKAPSKLDFGLVDVNVFIKTQQIVPRQLDIYPLFILPYRETEKPLITDHKGRTFLDENKQEAQTAILSGYINGLTRASNMYASTEKEDASGSSLKEYDGIKMVGGRIFNQKVNFFHPDYPDPSVLKALQLFDVMNSQETNQPSFAAMNREDSRKTAKEISVAENQQQLLNSVQLTMFSTYVREVYSFVWLLVQSKAIKGEISFMQIPQQQPVMNPMMGTLMMDPTTMQPVMQTVWVNDVATIAKIYDVRAAGDVDVIQRQELINQMMQDWPVVQNTPLRDQFLQDLFRLKYAEKGDEYAKVLGQQSQFNAMTGIIGRLSTILEGAIQQSPDLLTALPPEQQADVMKLIAQSKQMAAPMQQQPTQ